MKLLKQIRHNESPTINGFGLNVDDKFVSVPARQLEAPNIEYANKKLVPVLKGVWKGESMPFLIPESAKQWGILNTSSRTPRNELEDLIRMVGLFKSI